MLQRFRFALLTLVACLPLSAAEAEDPGDVEYAGDSEIAESVPASPKQGWGEFTVNEEDVGRSWWAEALLWLPNRLLDLIDVVKVDVGVGPAFGGVVRVTEYGQVGYRQMAPFSLRGGNFGRQIPIVIETSNELGAGPAYIKSKDRKVCSAEVGLGADVLIAGAYGGICFDELADFLGGLFFIDFKKDDI